MKHFKHFQITFVIGKTLYLLNGNTLRQGPLYTLNEVVN